MLVKHLQRDGFKRNTLMLRYFLSDISETLLGLASKIVSAYEEDWILLLSKTERFEAYLRLQARPLIKLFKYVKNNISEITEELILRHLEEIEYYMTFQMLILKDWMLI